MRATTVEAGVWGIAAAAAVAVGLSACSAGEGSAPRRPGDNGAPGTGRSMDPGSTSTGAGTTTGAGTSTGTGAPPPISVPDASRGDGALTSDAACTGEVRQGERLPLDMFFL